MQQWRRVELPFALHFDHISTCFSTSVNIEETETIYHAIKLYAFILLWKYIAMADKSDVQ